MKMFPRTKVGKLSLPRMLIGTNWFLGFSHQSPARDKMINEKTTSEVADILEVFLGHGIDAVLGFAAYDKLYYAVLLTPIPEPVTVGLVAAGLATLAARRKRRR